MGYTRRQCAIRRSSDRAQLREKVQLGVDQVSRGEETIIENDEQLSAFFDEIESEVQSELAAELKESHTRRMTWTELRPAIIARDPDNAAKIKAGQIREYGVVGPLRAFGLDALEHAHTEIGFVFQANSSNGD